MSDSPTPPITSEQFDNWLLSFPTKERKPKERILARQLRVSGRTITNWRQGRPIPAKHHEAIQNAMRGTEKVSIDFDEETYRRLEAKADEKGFKTVSEYLTELTKGFLALALLCAVGVYAARSQRTESAVVTSTAVEIPAAKKQRPEPDDD